MKRVICLTMVVMTLIFGSCQKNKDVVKIGAILPLTGSMAPYGLSVKRGIDLAIEEINAADGINGRNLEIIYEDSQADPKLGVSAFIKLSLMDKVPLVFGSITSVVLGIQPEADKNKVVLVNTTAISPLINEKSEDFLFNLVMNSATEAIAMANKFQSKHPNEKIAVFHVNNPSTTYTMDIFIETLTQLGNSNIIRETFEIETSDFRVNLDRIRRSGAKLGYLIAFSHKEFADIFRQTRELNMDIQWHSISTFESREIIELAGNTANGFIYSYPKIVDETLHAKFQKEYSDRHGAVADVLTVNSYDVTHLIATVMRQYGTSGQDIQRGLRTIDDFYGIFGKFRLSDTGKQYVVREYGWKTIENGEFIILEY